MLINKRVLNKLKNLSVADNISVILNKKVLLVWSYSNKIKNNFGDAINPILFEKITHKKVVDSKRVINLFHKPAYYFIGSILDNLSSSSAIICGSGFIKYNSKVLKKPQKIIAVRGPLTRETFLKQHIDCPEIYCDPALMLPSIYNPDNIEKKYDIGIIPHYVDKERYNEVKIINHGLSHHFIDIESDWKQIINEINMCKYILSSSLHGIVAAHAYNVPATRMILSDNITGGDFKFNDYALSVSNKFIEKYIINDSIDLKKAIALSSLFDTKKAAEALNKALDKEINF